MRTQMQARPWQSLVLVWRSHLSRKSSPNYAPPSHYLWAALIARTYEVLALNCPMCGGQMRIIALAAT